jgi:hypothetical protein
MGAVFQLRSIEFAFPFFLAVNGVSSCALARTPASKAPAQLTGNHSRSCICGKLKMRPLDVWALMPTSQL